MREEPLVEFRDACLGYGRRPVLAGVELTLGRGDFVGVLGPNGAGKSTLLKTILGLIRPLKGQMRLRGGASTPRFGYVPQREKLDALYPLSAREVAAMGTYRRFSLLDRLRGRSSDDELLRRSLRECGALELSERRYSELSGGQRQRVLIARALAAEPELLALDEPLAGIDVTTQKSLLRLLKGLREHEGLSVLMVSHRFQAERGLFTHIAWVDNGRVDFGPTEKMLAERRIAEILEEPS